MPRTLPWLVKDKPEKDVPAQESRDRSSSPADLVNSDLDAVSGVVTPKRRPKEPVDRSPSTSPPPAAPEVEFMREGLNADDVYMMVEDEFDATARLFTQHIHHAEYMRLKRLHKSRGAETLARLGHGTDTTTQQSRAVKMQIEAAENARKRKSAGAEDSGSDDDLLLDPALASLMNGSRKQNSKRWAAGLAKAKSNTRAAAGYSQRPRKDTRTKDVFAGSQRVSRAPVSSVPEDDETDDDDLDARPSTTRSAMSTAFGDVDSALDRPRRSTEAAGRDKPSNLGFFKQFAKKPTEQRSSGDGHSHQDSRSSKTQDSPEVDRKLSNPVVSDGKSTYTSRPSQSSNLAEVLARRRGKTQRPEARPTRPEVRIKQEPASPPPSRPKVTTSTSTLAATQSSRTSEVLARRKTEPVKIKAEPEEKVRPRPKPKADDIPTFLF